MNWQTKVNKDTKNSLISEGQHLCLCAYVHTLKPKSKATRIPTNKARVVDDWSVKCLTCKCKDVMEFSSFQTTRTEPDAVVHACDLGMELWWWEDP